MAETRKAKPKKSSAGSSKAKAKSGQAAAKASNGDDGHSLGDAVKNGAQGAVGGIAPVVQKAKVPLIAGGAAVAGVAGAVLASRSERKRKVLGVTVPKRSKLHLSLPKKNGFKSDARKATRSVTKAAQSADRFGKGVSRIAASVQQVGESADDAV
jgi:hypothetical protein